ncbi:MAG: zinc chelation protein SecC [Firmicutes bacterium]|nr:zinc chelation protein SecC [Bacillota bacterium]
MSLYMDRETGDVLMETLSRFGETLERYAARREKRFWREISIPSSFSDLLGRLTKKEMSMISKTYGFKRLSSLRKADLAAKLVELVPGRFAKTLYTLDQGRYSLLKVAVENPGALRGVDLEMEKAQMLLYRCLLFPGIYNNERMLYMPPELSDLFRCTDGVELEKIINRNTEWITLTHGMLYYYGVMGVRVLTERIERLTGGKVDYFEYLDVLTPAIEFYGQVRYSEYGICDCRVPDPKGLLVEHRSRQSVDYYPFTKRQLLKAAVPGYIDRTPALNDFLMFLTEYYDLSEADKNEIALQLIDIINIDGKSKEIIKYLESRLEIPSFDFLQLLVLQASELHNNTRQWVLKGHTPNELFQEEKEFLKPLPREPFLVEQAEPEVIDLKTRKKIGRNDPCPCGSGKKFKKCCGR